MRRVMPISSRRRPTRGTRTVNYNEDSEDEEVVAGDRLTSQTHPRRRRRQQHESTEAEGVGAYQPSEASEEEQEGKGGGNSDKEAPPPHKRRRTARRRSSIDNAPERDSRSLNPAWEHFTPPHLLSPPHSQDSDASQDIETVQIPAASSKNGRSGTQFLNAL